MEELVSDDAVLVCIDYQEKLLPKIFRSDRVVGNAGIMIEAARILGIPVVVTEQYPKGLGRTDRRLRKALGDYHPLEKTQFNCFKAPPFLESLRRLGRHALLIMGIESHICVSQTTVEAIRRGYRPYILMDAISSRTEENRRIGFERMMASGAIPSSVEMTLYELMASSDQPEFKEILKLVK